VKTFAFSRVYWPIFKIKIKDKREQRKEKKKKVKLKKKEMKELLFSTKSNIPK